MPFVASALWRPSKLKPFALPAAARWPLMLGMFIGVLLSFWIYVDTLSVPFLQEDVSHIAWLASRNPIDPFLSAEDAPAYRPLGKSIIKAWFLLLGEHDRPWLRFHNLALNALVTALIGRIATKLDTSRHRYWTGGLAAALFGAYPFAYQAIPWINNFFYPLENFLLLAMVAVYWQGRVQQRRGLIGLALFLCALAPFEIEYGVVGAGLLMVVEFYFWLSRRQSAPYVVVPFVGLGFNILYVLIWFNIPKDTYAFGGPTPERVYQIAHYFAQGLTYPISPLAQQLRAQGWTSDFTGLQLVILPTLLALALLLWRSKRGLLLLVTAAFFALLNFPALVFVDFDYVINSPRLLYPAGMAVVWLWGAALAPLFTSGKPLGPLLGSGLLLFTLWGNADFVRERMAQYHLIEQPVYQLMDAVEAGKADEQMLVVNFPAWLAPQERRFAIGNHGIQLIPFYIGLDESIFAHTGILQQVDSVQFANLLGDVPYYYGAKGDLYDYERMREKLLESGDTFLVNYSAESITLNPVGRATNLTPVSPLATYADTLAIATIDSALSEQSVQVSLQWTLQQAVTQDVTVFVHLYGPDGQLVAQADGDLLGGLAPFWLWPAGQTLEDVRTIALPADAPSGSYRVGVGVYSRADGARLAAVDAASGRVQDDVVTVFEFSR